MNFELKKYAPLDSSLGTAIQEPEIKKASKPVEFQDIRKSTHKVIHPEIVSTMNGVLQEVDKVEISSLGQIKFLTFGEYLKRMGINYDYYSNMVRNNPAKDQNEILRNLHQEAIDKRTRDEIRKHQEYTRESATRDNLQQETAKAHSPVFLKTVNDLDVYGLTAQSVPERLDYLDGIDEMLILDHESLQSSGEKKGRPIHIGIQRSFEDKKQEVTDDPIRFIPERPEIGVLFRVFIKEELSDYIDKDEKVSIWQKLLDIRGARARSAGMNPSDYAKKQKNEGLSPVYKVLKGGTQEQVERVENVLQNVKDQLQDYIASPDFKKQTTAVQTQLSNALQNMKIEDFLLALDDFKG